MALLYTLAERYLDMGETDTHVFFGFPWIKKHHEHDEADEAEALPEVLGSGGAPAALGSRVVIATVSRYAFRIAVALLTVGILVVGDVPRPGRGAGHDGRRRRGAHPGSHVTAPAPRRGPPWPCRPWASRCRPTPTATAAT